MARDLTVTAAARLDDRGLRGGGGAGRVRGALDRNFPRSGHDPAARRTDSELSAGVGRAEGGMARAGIVKDAGDDPTSRTAR